MLGGRGVIPADIGNDSSCPRLQPSLRRLRKLACAGIHNAPSPTLPRLRGRERAERAGGEHNKTWMAWTGPAMALLGGANDTGGGA
jgi:hypothetical protein